MNWLAQTLRAFRALWTPFVAGGVALAGSAGVILRMEKFGPYQQFGPVAPNVETQALALAKKRIIEDEGVRRDVYKDHLGKLTVGIGHLVLPGDNLRFGQVISDAQVNAFFAADIVPAFEAAKKQARLVGKYNADFIAALTAVNYQRGTAWTKIHENTWKSLLAGDPVDAVRRLKQSLWAKQTPNRVTDFVQAIERNFA